MRAVTDHPTMKQITRLLFSINSEPVEIDGTKYEAETLAIVDMRAARADDGSWSISWKHTQADEEQRKRWPKRDWGPLLRLTQLE